MDIKLQGLVTALITVSIIAYVVKKAAYAQKPGELRFGLFMKCLGLVCLLSSVIPFIIFLTENSQTGNPGDTTALISLTIGFGIGAIYILLESLYVKGTYDERTITFYTPWTGKKSEQWEDLDSVKFNILCSWHALKFKNGKIIRLSSYLGGHGHLLAYLKERGHNF